MWCREAVTRSGKKYSPSELPSGKIQLIQGIVCFLLCSLIAGLGSLTFFELKKDEMRNFKSQLGSVSLSVTENATGGLKRKILAASLISKMYATAMQDGYGGTSPNFTLPGFESEMTVLMELSGSKTIVFYPLVTNETRHGWEAYADANVDIVTLNGGRTVADGIYTQSSTGIVSSPSHAFGSNHPTWLFPVWQIAPSTLTSSIIMYDPYGVIGSRRSCIDRVIQTSKFAFTDIVQLLADEEVITPSTILYSPIMGPGAKNPIVGLASIAFSWGEVLNGILPGNYEVDCVVTTKTSK
jgi:CHASE domain